MMAFTKLSNTGQRKGKPEREEKLEHEINTPVNVTSVEGRMIQNVLMLEAVTTSMLKKVWKLETSATAQYAEIGQARVPQEFSFTLPMSHGFDNVAD